MKGPWVIMLWYQTSYIVQKNLSPLTHLCIAVNPTSKAERLTHV